MSTSTSTCTNPWRQQFFVISLLLLLLLPWHASSAAECQVKNAVGEDVTATVVTTTTNHKDIQQVLCQGDRACQNYAITNCEAVQCVGREACFQATLTNIGKLVECQQVHSCHRAMVHFAELDNNNNQEDNNLTMIQSMTCQGEGACNEAEIMGSRLVECFGPNACRNMKTRIDSVPPSTTHAEEYAEA